MVAPVAENAAKMDMPCVKTKLSIRPILWVLMIGYAGTRVCSAQASPQPGAGSPLREPETVAALVDSLARDWSGSVERDEQGHVVKLRLLPPWCNDRNIALVAQMRELRELMLQGGKATVQGLRLLRGNTNLCSLHFACFPVLPSGMLSELASFAQITEVRLYGASTTPSEYASLGNMKNLVDQQIIYARGFGDADLSRLTNSPSLKNLVVPNESLTCNSAALISQFRGLTNAELRGWPERTSWSTNWHSAAVSSQREAQRK
jgi:hypothetical protein